MLKEAPRPTTQIGSIRPWRRGSGAVRVVPLRLHPGAALRLTLEAWMGEREKQAGCVISAVGSLSVAQLRHRDRRPSVCRLAGAHHC